MSKIILEKYLCKRCNHSWLPRSEDKPTVCPKCNSPYWDKEKKIKSNSKEE